MLRSVEVLCWAYQVCLLLRFGFLIYDFLLIYLWCEVFWDVMTKIQNRGASSAELLFARQSDPKPSLPFIKLKPKMLSLAKWQINIFLLMSYDVLWYMAILCFLLGMFDGGGIEIELLSGWGVSGPHLKFCVWALWKIQLGGTGFFSFNQDMCTLNGDIG